MSNPQPLTPEQIYSLGDGSHAVHVRLTRLWQPEPRVIYEGPATLVLRTLDRVKTKKRHRGYPDQDFWFGITAPGLSTWAESSRQDYKPGRSGFAVEDYLTVIAR